VAANAALIELQGLVKTYHLGETVVRALDAVSLRLEAGEFCAVMGASGSGKSTLMNILGCLDAPDEGSYRLDGVEVTKLSPEELARIRGRKLGFVFQGFNLLARSTAAENVELPLIYAGVPAAERRRRSEAALAAVGLSGRGAHRPSQLSGGEQQRVAIARALVNNPEVVLADEPTGNLDSRTSHEIMGIFGGLNRERGITLVVVTHEPDIASYARRVVTFRDGRIIDDHRSSGRGAGEEGRP
jgi:putative ABC transport system ATP-binding protein